MHTHSNSRPHNSHININNMNMINNTAPVHTKTINNNHNNNLYNRLINNNNTHTYNDHYTLSLNRLSSDIIHNAKKGVGGNFVTLNSPYSGPGVEKIRGTKSDIGIPFDHRSTSKIVQNTSRKNSVMQKSLLPSVQSELSIYETTFNSGQYTNPYKNHSDMANNNNNSFIKTSTPSISSNAITFSKTGSKLLYSNKHRLEPTSVGINTINSNSDNNIINNNNKNINHDNSLAQKNSVEENVNSIIQANGPLLYINQEKKYCRRTNTVYNNQTMQSVS